MLKGDDTNIASKDGKCLQKRTAGGDSKPKAENPISTPFGWKGNSKHYTFAVSPAVSK